MAAKRTLLTKTAYAALHGVSRQAIHNAINQGLVFTDPDTNLVDVILSDLRWGRRHAFNEVRWGGFTKRGYAYEPVELDPETAARIDKRLAELQPMVDRWIAEFRDYRRQ